MRGQQDLMSFAVAKGPKGIVFPARPYFDRFVAREVAAKRSSKMTVAEFADYIEWIARWAATEYGIVVELPSDREAA